MSWLAWGVACAACMGVVDVISKRALREFEPAIVGTARLGFAIPLLSVPIILRGWPTLQPGFWPTVLAMLPLEVLAFFLLLEALRAAPLAETVPFLSITPLVTVLASWLILGERVTWCGFAGICVVGAGGYLLYGHELRHGYLGPFRAMVRSRGTRLMVLVALLYSVTSTLGKRAIARSDPLTFPGIYFAILWLAFALALWCRGHRPKAFWHAVRRRPGLLISMGLLDGTTFLLHAVGILRAPVAYFISVKRLSSVVSIVLGGWLFREDHLRLRILGAACMAIGVVLLALGS